MHRLPWSNAEHIKNRMLSSLTSHAERTFVRNFHLTSSWFHSKIGFSPVWDGSLEFPRCPSDKEKTCQIVLIPLNFYPISSKHTILLFCIALKKWDHNSNVIQKYFSQFRFHLRELECKSVSRLHLWFSVSTPCNHIMIVIWQWDGVMIDDPIYDDDLIRWYDDPMMTTVWLQDNWCCIWMYGYMDLHWVGLWYE